MFLATTVVLNWFGVGNLRRACYDFKFVTFNVMFFTQIVDEMAFKKSKSINYDENNPIMVILIGSGLYVLCQQ